MTEVKRADYLPHPGSVTVFSASWCGFCTDLKAELDAQDIAYQEVNIGLNEEAAELVQQLNGGGQTIPTVIFPDGSSATNPSLDEVMQRLNG